MYMIPFWTSSATAKNFPTKAYHSLEAQSSFASPEFGVPKGGLSMIQLIRYHETPVGPYDEMIICPGSFAYPTEDKDGKKTTKTALRITCLYVSQKYTCWNGRKSKSPSHQSPIRPPLLTPPQSGASPNTSPTSTGPTTPTAPPKSRSTRTTTANPTTPAPPTPAPPAPSPSSRQPSTPSPTSPRSPSPAPSSRSSATTSP